MTSGIVDAHHHLWDLSRFPYPWLRPGALPRPFGDQSQIMRNYLPADYRRDTSGIQISATVHVEAGTGSADAAAETIWLNEVRANDGIAVASIAHIDPASPTVTRDLDAICAQPGIRGVRVGIAWRADSLWHFASGPGIARSRQFRKGIVEISKRGLLIEFVLLPEQLSEVDDLAKSHPDLRIVLNHLATLQPEIPGQIEIWRAGIQKVSEAQNVFVKLSGLWSIARDWDIGKLRDPVRFVIDTFGEDRCMWGSNLPVEGLMCAAEKQIRTLESIIEDRHGGTREAIFSKTARRVYQLRDPK